MGSRRRGGRVCRLGGGTGGEGLGVVVDDGWMGDELTMIVSGRIDVR